LVRWDAKSNIENVVSSRLSRVRHLPPVRVTQQRRIPDFDIAPMDIRVQAFDIVTQKRNPQKAGDARPHKQCPRKIIAVGSRSKTLREIW
jgi:hypothetical protein